SSGAPPGPAVGDIRRRGGALASGQVGPRDEARPAADAGCDFVTVQGTEAGGHIRGHSPLLPLLESVLGELDLPVLAAGGIGDGRAFAPGLAAGGGGGRGGGRGFAPPGGGGPAPAPPPPGRGAPPAAAGDP